MQTRDSAGFIVNRLLIPYMLDAIRAYEEGVGSIAEIDAAMKAGAATRWGRCCSPTSSASTPSARSATSLFDEFRERALRAPPLLRKMLAPAGTAVTGMGFYDYSGEAPVPNPGI